VRRAAVLLALLAGAARAESPLHGLPWLGDPNPHGPGPEADCLRCHGPGEQVVVGDPIALCAQCHDASRMRHPFRVVQEPPPEGLPLMAGGFVACHTCHDPHDPAARPHGLRLAFRELCLRCHQRHGTRKPDDAVHRKR
jgi:predicted CXXCH cytochrome family protein